MNGKGEFPDDEFLQVEIQIKVQNENTFLKNCVFSVSTKSDHIGRGEVLEPHMKTGLPRGLRQ